MDVQAHRGSPDPSSGILENTVEAFLRSARLGADGVELDVRLTRDGALAVHHDPAIPGLGPVAELDVGQEVGREARDERIRGELGWSAERMKAGLSRADRTRRTRAWREYVCESFCDSAAWLLAGSAGNEEFTLPAAARRARRVWFEQTRLTREISV